VYRLSSLLAVLIGVLLLALASTAFADDDDDDDDGGGGSGSRPSVTSASATGISTGGAVLRAYVNPEGRSTTYHFQYGPTTAYGATSPPASAGSSSSWRLVSATVSGLQAATTYHYRVVATNSGGTTVGSDRTFTTLPASTPGGQGPGTGGDGSAGTSGGETPSDPSSPADGDTSAGPQLGAKVTLEPGKGVVRVRRPGSASFVALSVGAELPVGSEVDARRGSVALSTALPSGKIQTGRFGGGRFLIRQRSTGLVDLYLRGQACHGADPKPAKGRGSTVAGAARRPRSGRRLWGRDHGGRFRTHGRNSHATVRGTRWLVVDRCDGTLTRVSDGSVVVYDKVRKNRLVLAAGERYLARPRR
jgi:hypothetical protein